MDLEKIVKPLLAWYDGHARVLPWREEPTPYRVWISEIMLQQTRVEAVKPYFERFINALPDVNALANVEDDVLLKLWEGLGYYNRSRNLKKAALQIVDEFSGELPADYDKLLTLSGIGHYTAGAVSSIAYGIRMPAVDGNVLRVIARVRADERDILMQSTKTGVEKDLLEIMPYDRPGDFNQALMELGATVCIPNGPAKCEQCPWHTFCEAREQNCIQELPKKTKKKPRVIEEKTILIIKDGDKAAIKKRPDKGLLAGLYEFPSMEGCVDQDTVLSYMKKLNLAPLYIEKLESAKHIFTHREWHMIAYAVRVDELSKMLSGKENEGFLFVETKEVEEKYPMPSAFSAYTKYVNIKLGNEKFSK